MSSRFPNCGGISDLPPRSGPPSPARRCRRSAPRQKTCPPRRRAWVFSKNFSKMLKPTEPTSAEHSSAEVFVTGRKVSPGSGTAFPGDTARPERPASLCDALPVAPACDAVFAGFPLFSGGSPFPEGLVLPDDAQTAAPPSFADFALGVYPFLELEPFHRAYYRVLEAFAAGRVRRLIVTMPPQHIGRE